MPYLFLNYLALIEYLIELADAGFRSELSKRIRTLEGIIVLGGRLKRLAGLVKNTFSINGLA